MNQRRVRLQGVEGIGNRLEHFVVNPDVIGSLARVKRRVGHDHGETVGDATGELAFGHKHRLVRVVEAGAADAGHIGRREDPNDAAHCGGRVRMNFQNPRARVLRQHHRAVQHARAAQVVDERLLAKRLRQTLESRGRSANAVSLRSTEARSAKMSTPTIACGKCRIATEAELFAEEQMSTRFFARQQAAISARFTRRLDGVDNPSVARAAAQMTIKGFGDSVPVARATLRDQRRSADENSRNTESALHGAFEDECFAQGAPRLVGQALHSRHVMTVHLLRLAQAGQRRRPINEDQTAAAGPFRSASVLGGEGAALLPQNLEELHTRLVRGVGDFPV